MPFIGPKVRELSGRLIPTSPVRQVSGRCGHRPLREFGDFTIQLSQASTFRAPLHTRRKRGHSLQAGEGRGFPHPSRLRRATFPGGEGCLRRGITVYLLCCLSGISPGDSSTGCYTAVERGCGEGGYPQKYSTALLQAVEKFSRFSRRLRRQGRGEMLSFRVILFLFVLYSSLSTVISWFSTKFIHSCGYSCG